MTTTDPYAGFGTRQTHQQHRAPDRPEQVKNNAGGYVFQIDPLTQLKRFLTIGTVGGSYYVGEKELTRENGEMILSFTRNPTTHAQLVDTIVEISLAGRAPKQNPTLFALAIACQHGDTASKQYARKQLTKVVRTGTHLFLFVGYVRQFGGWNRGMGEFGGETYVPAPGIDTAYGGGDCSNFYGIDAVTKLPIGFSVGMGQNMQYFPQPNLRYKAEPLGEATFESAKKGR